MLAFAAIYIIWGTTYLAIRVAVETIPPFLMAGVRFLIAGFFAFLFLRARGVPLPTRLQWRSAAIVGAFMLLGGNGLVTWAEQQVPSGIAALVVATVPLWMTLFDWLFAGGRRPGRRTTLGLVLGFAGIGLLIGPRLFVETTSVSPASWLILFLAPILWSVGSLYSRRALLPENTFMSTALEMLLAGFLLLLAGLVTGEGQQLDVASIAPRSLLAMLYLTIFGSIVALTAYVWLLKNVDAARVATYTYVNPIIAVFLGWLLLSEAISAQMLGAVAIIVFAVLLITMRKPGSSLAGEEENGRNRVAAVPSQLVGATCEPDKLAP
jgi:drug/metabolite transporter (DMT)-like permease